MEYNSTNLEDVYQELTSVARAEATLLTDMIGGQPADEDGIRSFAKFKLKLDGDDLESAVRRIMEEEIRKDVDTTPAGGEVGEKETYGINVLRRDGDDCAWIGDWQLKAALKCAASRLGIFVAKRGSKGDIAEVGRVSATGQSLDGDRAHIRILTTDGSPFREHLYTNLMGRVSTPQGAKSITYDAEYAPAGCRFSWELRIPNDKFSEEDIVNIFAMLGQVGVGSARALEHGKFRIDKLIVNMLPAAQAKAKKKG